MARSRSSFCAAALFSLGVAALAPCAAGATSAAGLRCEELAFEVTLAPGDPTTYEVWGELCSRGSLQHKTIQVALAGSTYSHLYWDWPYQPHLYSYVKHATAAGYAVLNLDRIGTGRSDHPPAAELTIASNAHVVHQIVEALRGGNRVVRSFGRIRAERVVLVGHSLGSLIAIHAAATYGDVDGVVLTGITHTVTPALGDLQLYPASLDPRFADLNLPEGYLTTVPGGRAIFYNPPFFDPQVLALDEATKETVTVNELGTAPLALGLSNEVHVPVLVVVGDNDPAFCNPPTCSASGTLDIEPSFYPADACAQAVSIPGAGHDLNLHYQAPLTYGVVLHWIDRYVGRNPRVAPPQSCP